MVEQNRHSANRSMVADGGQAYLSGVPERGTLRDIPLVALKRQRSDAGGHMSFPQSERCLALLLLPVFIPGDAQGAALGYSAQVSLTAVRPT